MKETVSENKRGKVGAELDFASREAFNLLRTNISFAFPDEKRGKVVGVCSACPQEGKSTTSINLAYSLADSGKKVILIDADMRRPSVYNVLDLPMEPGLSDMLCGNCGEEEIKNVLREGLNVLPAGHIPPNPSELIGSRTMGDLIDKYKDKYDYIIVDLPPVLSVSDPIAISKYLGGMIIVVRHEHTRRRDIAETIRQLGYADVKVLGFVYNRVGQKSTGKKHAKGSYYYGKQ